MKTAQVKFTASPAEKEAIEVIAKEANRIARKAGIKYPVLDAMMDIEAAHCNGCPLRLDELMVTDEFNFCHDVFGIRKHLDRTNGRIGGCFVPRFAA